MYFNPAGFVQGYEQGLDRQAKQEQLKMQKTEFETNQVLSGQKIDQNNMTLAQLKRVEDANKRLESSYQRDVVDVSLKDMFKATNPDELAVAAEKINTSPVMKGKTIAPVSERDMDKAVKYMEGKGYSPEPYIVDEDGKYRAPNKLDPNEMQQARANAMKDTAAFAKGMIDKGQLVINSDGVVAGIEDIAALTGHFDRYPSSQKVNDEIIAGIRDKIHTEKPTAYTQGVYGKFVIDYKMAHPNATIQEIDKAYNTKKEGTGDANPRMDSLTQMREAERALTNAENKMKSATPGTPAHEEAKKAYQRAEIIYSSITGGKGQAAQTLDENQNIAAREKNAKLAEVPFESLNKVQLEELKQIQDNTHNNYKSNPNIMATVKDVTKELRNTKVVVDKVQSFENEFGEKLKTGTLDKGFIADPVQWMSKKFTGGELTPEQEAKTLELVKSDTKLGIIVTEFIKATTGLAMTDQERRTYNDIITGGAGADGPTILAAISAFKESLVESNKGKAESLKDYSPYDAKALTTYVKPKVAVSQPKPIQSKPEVVTQAKPDVTQNGVTFTWNGTAYVPKEQ